MDILATQDIADDLAFRVAVRQIIPLYCWLPKLADDGGA